MSLDTEIIKLAVSYSQIGVFVSSIRQPFNDWTEAHVRQGFAWRPGSVFFRTLREAGEHRIEVRVDGDKTAPSRDAVRVIEVPFEMRADGRIEIASVSDSVPFSLTGSGLRYCIIARPGASLPAWLESPVFTFPAASTT